MERGYPEDYDTQGVDLEATKRGRSTTGVLELMKGEAFSRLEPLNQPIFSSYATQNMELRA
jgi:hypothetical protein